MEGNVADLLLLEVGNQKLPGVRCVQYIMHSLSNGFWAANVTCSNTPLHSYLFVLFSKFNTFPLNSIEF